MRAAATAEPPPPPPVAGATPGDPERAQRLRADDAVDLEPVGGLEGAHRPPRLAPEHAVGADAERALDGDRRRGRGHGAAGAPRAAPAAERAARDRPDHAVDLEPVRGLERAHRPTRLAPEDPVGGDPERALHVGDGRAATPHAQEVARGGAGHLGALRACGVVDRREHGRGHQGRGDERLLPAVDGRAARGGGLAAPDGARERALPQVVAAQVAATRRQRSDRPAVVVQVHAPMEPGRADGLMNRAGSSTTAAVSSHIRSATPSRSPSSRPASGTSCAASIRSTSSRPTRAVADLRVLQPVGEEAHRHALAQPHAVLRPLLAHAQPDRRHRLLGGGIVGRPEHDRRRVARLRVGQLARARVVDAGDHGDEVGPELADEQLRRRARARPPAGARRPAASAACSGRARPG